MSISNINDLIEKVLRDIRYQTIIKELSRSSRDEYMDNSDPVHAEIVIKELLERADKEVYILTDHFSEKFYRNLFEELLNFLKKGKKLHILSLNSLRDNIVLKKLKEELGDRFEDLVEIRIIPEDKKDELRVPDGRFENFIIDDRKGVRYELLEDIKNNIASAIVNFGNEELHRELKQKFSELWEAGSKGEI